MISKPNKNKKEQLICPECDSPIKTSEKIQAGLIVECPACACESEIVTSNPLKLSPLEEEK